jgi:hypothetical protein
MQFECDNTRRNNQTFFKGVLMSRYISILILAVFLSGLGGCDDNPVQAPVQSTAPTSAQQQGLLKSLIQPLLQPLLNVQLLTLPKSLLSLAPSQYKTQSWVTSQSGGQLSLDVKYPTFLIFDVVHITSTFTVQPHAISQDELITMTLNTSNLEFDYSPQGLQFSTPATLNCAATGLDLSTVPSGTPIELFYCEPNGSYDEIPAGSITYDVKTGTVTCCNAQISHFSQYAFGYIKK